MSETLLRQFREGFAAAVHISFPGLILAVFGLAALADEGRFFRQFFFGFGEPVLILCCHDMSFRIDHGPRSQAVLDVRSDKHIQSQV